MDARMLFEDRARASQDRLTALRADLSTRIDAVEREFDDPQVCIYATGSLARGEATSHSDLDAFFLLSGSQSDRQISRIRDVRILNAVVEAAETHAFPDFSNEGEFLKFLHIEDMIDQLGSREDDYNNAFTARMLMILESKFLYNDDLYRRAKLQIVNTYYRDFHDHVKSFRPVFLLNDVLRFWRTLCINYEYSREWREDNAEKTAKGHLGNLKLRFSRLCICFSFVSHLLSKGASVSPADVVETTDLAPLDRLRDLTATDPDLSEKVGILLDKYAWFLENVGRGKKEVLGWISQKGNRDLAFAESQVFVEAMGEVVRRVADKHGYLRYLII